MLRGVEKHMLEHYWTAQGTIGLPQGKFISFFSVKFGLLIVNIIMFVF